MARMSVVRSLEQRNVGLLAMTVMIKMLELVMETQSQDTSSGTYTAGT